MMPPTDEEALITEAATLAREAEVVVLVLGMNNDWGREGVDRSTLSLPCRTEDLIHAVCAANPNTVIVNQSACAVDMSWTDKPAAVIQAWYQGQENGNAIADVLLGLANPSGKLPIIFPRAIEDHGLRNGFLEIWTMTMLSTAKECMWGIAGLISRAQIHYGRLDMG